MKEKDEDLQNGIERNGAFGDESQDANVYRHIFRALEKEPKMMLSESFADKVMTKVEVRKSSSVRDFVWLGVGIFFSLIALVIVFVMSGVKMDLGFLKGMSDYKGLFIFAIGLMIAFNFFEKRLIRSREA
jgi:hypothetical protein